jgi:hypothetical protein
MCLTMDEFTVVATDATPELVILASEGFLPKQAWGLDKKLRATLKPAAEVCIHGGMKQSTVQSIISCTTVKRLVLAGDIKNMLHDLTQVEDVRLMFVEDRWPTGWGEFPGAFQGDLTSFAATVKTCTYEGNSLLANLPQLGSMTALRALILNQCSELTALPELSTLTALQTLDLYGCQGLTVLPELSTLTALQTLNLACCSELTALPELGSLTALQTH